MKLFIPILDNGDGSVKANFMQSMLSAFSGQIVQTGRIADSHPGRARNRAVADFLATDCTHILFIDADIIFTKDDIELLNASDEPILAGLYPKKVAERLEWCFVALPENNGRSIKAGEVFEIKRAGTGFLRIARDVFEEMKITSTGTPHYNNHGRDEWDWFESGVRRKEWLSEDWLFCDKARQCGFRVMAHSGIQLKHEGNFIYPKAPDRLKWCPPDMRVHIEQIWRGEYNMPVEPKTILDIGGNIGGFAVWASERWPDAHIQSFEPHPDNVAAYKLNTHNIRCEVFNYGVTETGGTMDLVEGMNCGEHSFHFPLTGTNTVTVECIKPSRLLSYEFVKIDTEGCELEILRGLDLHKTKAIALEYHSASDRSAIRELLSSRGYAEHEHTPRSDNLGILKFIRP